MYINSTWLSLFTLKFYENVIKEYRTSGYTVYLLVNTILGNTLHLHMLHRQLLDQQAAPPTILNSGSKSPLTKAFVQLAPFLDQPWLFVTMCT